MLKKILLGLLGVLIIGGGALFMINGKDNYDATKYSATVTDGLSVGSKINLTLPDQFDKSHSVTDETKTLILSFAKETGHTAKEFLAEQSTDYLPSRDALFIADISPMPTVIRNTFALPDLQKSAFAVLLIYDGKISAQIKNNDKADKIAIVTLNDKVITAVDYITTKQELETALK